MQTLFAGSPGFFGVPLWKFGDAQAQQAGGTENGRLGGLQKIAAQSLSASRSTEITATSEQGTVTAQRSQSVSASAFSFESAGIRASIMQTVISETVTLGFAGFDTGSDRTERAFDRAERVIARGDTDGDSALSFAEIQAKRPEGTLARNFKEADTNSDGVLSIEETGAFFESRKRSDVAEPSSIFQGLSFRSVSITIEVSFAFYSGAVGLPDSTEASQPTDDPAVREQALVEAQASTRQTSAQTALQLLRGAELQTGTTLDIAA
ncbi:MAG: hypothetical protein AAFU80_24425 [Pseudomonadota bacterium]